MSGIATIAESRCREITSSRSVIESRSKSQRLARGIFVQRTVQRSDPLLFLDSRLVGVVSDSPAMANKSPQPIPDGILPAILASTTHTQSSYRGWMSID